MEYFISALLIIASGLFSGLTLGFFTLDVHTLKRRAELGNQQAKRIYPLRRRGNQLLSTLLLGNVAVNATLSIYLGSIASGVVAGISATALIFFLGEIVPQAVFSRHALYLGSMMAPLVRVMMFVATPITFPISYTLDKLLGHEMKTLYSKKELMYIISEHEDSEESPIDSDEERILHGALKFSHTTVAETMTPADEVVCYPITQILNEKFRKELVGHGYSRYPIYSTSKDPKDRRVIGILYARDIMIEKKDITIDNAAEAYDNFYLSARPNEYLNAPLARMLKKKQHMCIVEDQHGLFLGVLTLEDIIEEILQQEIEDEDDE